MRSPAPAFITLVTLLSGTLSAQDPRPSVPDPLREHYQAAQTFQLAGDLDRAEAEYSREVVPRALRRLAALASAEGRHGDARRYLETALVHQPGNADLTLDLVVVLLRGRDVDAARRLVRQAVSADRRNARAARLYGKVLLIADEDIAARTELERSMTLASEFDTGLSLAYANLRTGRLTEARALFDEMVARSPSADIRGFIGRAYLENGFAEAAAAQFTEALRRDGGHEPSKRLLEEIKAGKPFARDSIQTVLLQEPPLPSEERGARRRQLLADVLAGSYFNLGVIYSRRQRPGDAADAMLQAAAWKPDLEGIDRALGVALFYADRFSEAIPPLEQHMALHPGDEGAKKLLGTSYLMTDRAAAPKVVADTSPGATPAAVSDLDLIAADVASGNGAEAERKLWTLLVREPANTRALGMLGNLLLSGNRPAEAESIFRRAAELAATDTEAWLGLARVLGRQGRAADARDALEKGLAHNPDDPGLEYETARVLLDLNDPRSALAHLARVPESRRPPGGIAVETGALLALGETEPVQALLTRAAATADAATAVTIVNLLLQHARPADARRLVDETRARIPATAPLVVAGAKARRALGDRDDAEAWYEQALGLDSTLNDALIGLGELLAERGDASRATELFLIARSHGDQSPALLRSLALAAAAALRFEEALDAAGALTAMRPDEAEAANLLGTIQLQVSDWPAAEKTFQQMAALDARDSRAPLGIGIARYGQRKFADAEASLETSLALDPNQGEAHYQLALVARDDGRSSAAIARLDRAVALAPRHQAAHVVLGSLLVEAGEYRRALPILERAVSLGPASPDPYYQLGLLYARLKEPERARQAMEQFRRRKAEAGTKPHE